MFAFMLVFGGFFVANTLFVWMEKFISSARTLHPTNPFDLDDWD